MDAGFSKRLDSLRGKLTQKQFAKKLGIPLTTYTNWVAGIRTPSADAVITICTQMGVSADWLLGLREDNSAQELKIATLKAAMQAVIDKY